MLKFWVSICFLSNLSFISSVITLSTISAFLSLASCAVSAFVSTLKYTVTKSGVTSMEDCPFTETVFVIEGFKLLNPDNGLHGISGRTIAHVTEQYLNQDYIDVLLREVGDAADYLIIYAKTISSKIKLPENVEVRRIPDVLLRRFKV